MTMTFIKFPKFLFTGTYKELSSEAKILYCLFGERQSLSTENNWRDQNGTVFFYFSTEQIMEQLHISKATACKTVAALVEKKLLRKEKQGLGKPDRLYLLSPETEQENKEESHSSTSERIENKPQAVYFSYPNKTESNNTEFNKTNLSDLITRDISTYDTLVYQASHTKYATVIDRESGIEYQRYFASRFQIDLDKEYIDPDLNFRKEVVYLLSDVLTTKKSTVLIGKEEKPYEVVKSRLCKLTTEQLTYVQLCLSEYQGNIKNVRSYLLTALYRSMETMMIYYKQRVQKEQF